MKKQLIYSSLLCTVMLVSSCRNTTEAATELPATTEYCLHKDFKELIATETLQKRPIAETLTLTGNIAYNENDVVAFKSLLGGVVENVSFELGDYVKKGQVLATVRSSELNEITQEKRSLVNRISFLNHELKTKQSLLQDGMISSSEYENAKTEYENAKVEMQRIDQNLSMYNATSNAGLFQIKAPKEGYIVQKEISMGLNISALEEPLFTISNLNQIWVMVNIYATNLQHVKEGAAVKVRTLAYPDDLFDGKIDKIYNVFDDSERVLKARVLLQNTALKLKPGMSADIIIEKNASSETAIAIPNDDIVFSNNKQYVIIYKSDCDLEIRLVKPYASNLEYTYVLENFKEGEKVISKNELLLFEELNK